MELAFGWQPLRHGAAVPSLLAHWCVVHDRLACCQAQRPGMQGRACLRRGMHPGTRPSH